MQICRIVGIDPSFTRTGVCILDNCQTDTPHPTFYSITSSKKYSVFERQKQIVNNIKNLLHVGDVVIFEDFAISARFSPSGRFCERIELCGMLKLISPCITKLPWLVIAPTMLKSFMTNKSTAHKIEVINAVKSQDIIPVKQDINDDEADAFVLALYTYNIFYNQNFNTKKQDKFLNYSSNATGCKQIRTLISIL